MLFDGFSCNNKSLWLWVPAFAGTTEILRSSLRAQAKQSIVRQKRKKEWIASSQELLAMTLRHTFAISPHAFCARYSFIPALSNKGRRECRAADAPDSRVCDGSG